MDKTTNYCNHGGWFTMSKGHYLDLKKGHVNQLEMVLTN